MEQFKGASAWCLARYQPALPLLRQRDKLSSQAEYSTAMQAMPPVSSQEDYMEGSFASLERKPKRGIVMLTLASPQIFILASIALPGTCQFVLQKG